MRDRHGHRHGEQRHHGDDHGAEFPGRAQHRMQRRMARLHVGPDMMQRLGQDQHEEQRRPQHQPRREHAHYREQHQMHDLLRGQRAPRKGQRHHEAANQQQQKLALDPLQIERLKLVDIGGMAGLGRDVDDPLVYMQAVGIYQAGGEGKPDDREINAGGDRLPFHTRVRGLEAAQLILLQRVAGQHQRQRYDAENHPQMDVAPQQVHHPDKYESAIKQFATAHFHQRDILDQQEQCGHQAGADRHVDGDDDQRDRPDGHGQHIGHAARHGAEQRNQQIDRHHQQHEQADQPVDADKLHDAGQPDLEQPLILHPGFSAMGPGEYVGARQPAPGDHRAPRFQQPRVIHGDGVTHHRDHEVIHPRADGDRHDQQGYHSPAKMDQSLTRHRKFRCVQAARAMRRRTKITPSRVKSG